MPLQRIYSPGLNAGVEHVELGQEDLHYLKHVLRLKPGAPVILFDGTGGEYDAVIDSFETAAVTMKIYGMRRVDDPSPPILLAQALPKESKMDFIVQKATELGVSAIIPFTSTRTVPKLTDEKAQSRVNRWRKIAAEASKQCGSARIPRVSDILSFDAMIDEAADSPLRLFFWEEENDLGVGDILRSAPEPSGISVVVGPEGGFSRSEASLARERGFTTVHLGRRILRVETAALVILSIIQYETGSIGSRPERKTNQ